MAMINLPYGNNCFNPDDLKKYIRGTGRNYIIQGQVHCKRVDHPKPSSLDCWLRDNFCKNQDTAQAVNSVIADLVETGGFEIGKFCCPDSGYMGKGIKIKE